MKIAATFFGAASLLAAAVSGSSAQEMTAQPLGLASGGLAVTDAAFGCGPGFVPNRFGACRPRFYGGYGYGYGRPYGYRYGYRPYGYRRFGFY